MWSDSVPKMANKMADAPVTMWINLARSADRRARMQAELDALGVRHSRVEAVDGRDLERHAALHGVRVLPHPSGSPMENACMASHVLALRAFLAAHPDEPRALVLEDDASFDYMPFWRKSIGRYLDATPGAPGIVQLAVMLADPSDVAQLDPEAAVPRPLPNWFSTAAYAIERWAAEAIVRFFVVEDGSNSIDSSNGGVTIDLGRSPCTVHADIVLYSMVPTHTLPLFTFTCDCSYIHPQHVPSHVVNRQVITEWWARTDLTP